MKPIILNAAELLIAPEDQRLAWTPNTQATVVASLRLLSRLQPSPCTHRVHEAATGMSPSPSATPITARSLSEPFGHPVRLTRSDWGSAASAQAVVPFMLPPLVCGEFPSCSRQLVYVHVCVSECVSEWYTSPCISSTCRLLNESCIQSVQQFEPVGVPNRFATVEKIITNCLMLNLRPGGMCTCVGECLSLAETI